MGSNWMMVMLVVSLYGPVPVAGAVEAADNGNAWPQGNACHPLLMAAECLRHQAALSALPFGPERERYLAAQRELIEDREKACNGQRQAEMVILQPARQLKF